MSDDALEARVGTALTKNDATVAVAESATGGLVCSRLTDVPGSSDYFDRGFVTYAYEAKTGSLGVDRAAIDTHGAVSRPVATQMASAARDIAGTTWGLSVTGTAGPSGGTAEKPVGTVIIGVAYAGAWGTNTTWVTAERYTFDGPRTEIKEKAASQALHDLLESIENQ